MYDDFLEAIEGKHHVRLYDARQPLASQFADTQVVVDQGGWGTHGMIDAALAGGAKLWQIIGTGLNHIDVAYVLGTGIPLANSPGFLSGVALAEHALFLMLCLSKNLNASQRNFRSGVFYHPMNEELEGKTLGLIGFGGSGRELAKRAWAFGMRTLAIDVTDVPKAVQEAYHAECLGGPQELESLLQQSDYVSIHAPLTSQTERMIHRSAFELMKPTAYLINVARGEIVDEEALVDALRTHRIRGAGLDAFSKEPLPSDHPFLHLENVVLSPHIAGGTRETVQRRSRAAAQNVFRAAEDLPPLHQILAPE